MVARHDFYWATRIVSRRDAQSGLGFSLISDVYCSKLCPGRRQFGTERGRSNYSYDRQIPTFGNARSASTLFVKLHLWYHSTMFMVCHLAPIAPSENGNLIAIAAYSCVRFPLRRSTRYSTHVTRYTAMEDNEISFSEGDEIFFIDTSVSEDWWQGTLSNGASGLFPGAGPLNPAEWPISNPIPLYSPYYHTKATYVELQK